MSAMIGPTRLITLAIVLTALTTGCGNDGPSARPHGPAGSESQSTGVPDPFTIRARYDARSLGLTNPRSLAIGPDGNLYVTDASQRVSVVSPEGHVLGRWGAPGHGPGEFSFVSSHPSDPYLQAKIAVGANGLVYVSDSGNGRVEVFTPTGTFLRQIASPGRGEGHLVSPFDVAVDASGNVFVADDARRSVSKFSPDGRFLWRIGAGISADPDLQGHEHFSAVDAHGRLVMSNDDTGAVMYVDTYSHIVERFQQTGCDVSVDAAGNTYVNDCDGRIRVFDRQHRFVGLWDSGAEFSPRFGPSGEQFLLNQGTVMRLQIALH